MTRSKLCRLPKDCVNPCNNSRIQGRYFAEWHAHDLPCWCVFNSLALPCAGGAINSFIAGAVQGFCRMSCTRSRSCPLWASHPSVHGCCVGRSSCCRCVRYCWRRICQRTTCSGHAFWRCCGSDGGDHHHKFHNNVACTTKKLEMTMSGLRRGHPLPGTAQNRSWHKCCTHSRQILSEPRKNQVNTVKSNQLVSRLSGDSHRMHPHCCAKFKVKKHSPLDGHHSHCCVSRCSVARKLAKTFVYACCHKITSAVTSLHMRCAAG